MKREDESVPLKSSIAMLYEINHLFVRLPQFVDLFNNAAVRKSFIFPAARHKE